MKKYSELVVLFKKVIYQDQEIEFIPIKTIEGIFSKKDNCFIDKDGTPYYHIIENPDSYGYCYRDSIINYKKDTESVYELTNEGKKALELVHLVDFLYHYRKQ